MPTLKPGQREIRYVLDEGSEAEMTLMEWASKRGLSLGKASRCIVVDFTEALNGKVNPFAMAMVAANMHGQFPGPVDQSQRREGQVPQSAEEQAREAAKLEAAGQFL